MKNIIRKSIYGVLYLGIICAFIYIGSKDYNIKEYNNDQEKFSADYQNIPKTNNFEYLNSTELIDIIKNGTGIIFIGDKDNIWSQEYAKYLYEVVNEENIEKVYYFDAKKIKTLKNNNYYALIKALDGNLISTDTSDDNLFTPSLYIIKDGKVIFVDATSAVVKNSDKPKTFWTNEKVEEFKERLSTSMNLIVLRFFRNVPFLLNC